MRCALFYSSNTCCRFWINDAWVIANIRSFWHYNDFIMGAMASQITSLTIVYSSIYSGADQRKHQSSASLAFVRGIHRWPVNSSHKWPVTRKMFPFDDVIMILADFIAVLHVCFFSTLSHDTNGNKYNRNWYQSNLNEQPAALLFVSLTFHELFSSHINHYYQKQSLYCVTRIIQWS